MKMNTSACVSSPADSVRCTRTVTLEKTTRLRSGKINWETLPRFVPRH